MKHFKLFLAWIVFSIFSIAFVWVIYTFTLYFYFTLPNKFIIPCFYGDNLPKNPWHNYSYNKESEILRESYFLLTNEQYCLLYSIPFLPIGIFYGKHHYC